MDNVYSMYAFNTAGGLFDGLQSFNVSSELQRILNEGDGMPDQEFAAIMEAQPRLTFSTVKVSHALNICAFDGLAISATATAFFQKRVNKGIMAGTLQHLRGTFTSGLLIPRRLSAVHGDEAIIEYELAILSSNGTSDPWTWTDSQSLSGSPVTDEKFTVGGATINNVALDSVRSIELDFGLELTNIGQGGEPYRTFVGIKKRKPSLIIETYDMTELNTYGTGGVGISSATNFTLDKIAQNGTRSGTDITCTINEGMVTIDDAGGSNDDDGQITRLRIDPTFDGTNDQLVFTGVS